MTYYLLMILPSCSLCVQKKMRRNHSNSSSQSSGLWKVRIILMKTILFWFWLYFIYLYSNNCTYENLSYFFYRKSRVSTTRPEKEICRKGTDQMCFSNIDLKLNYQLLKKKITSIYNVHVHECIPKTKCLQP